ncbi:MAG: nucleoside hydrolase [Alphaproteobacteria bacterium]
MNKNKIIIDTDPGVDDAIAIFLALASPEIEVLGLTTVAGNVPLETSFDNARRICALANRKDIPIFKGFKKPLKRDFVDAAWVHGNDGIGGVTMPESDADFKKEHAVDFLLRTIRMNDDKTITLATLGPLTNIAAALTQDLETMKRLKKIVIMGGSFDKNADPRGNSSLYAEYNIFADPHAADIVFKCGIDMVIVPMETGKQAVADRDFINKVEQIDNPCAQAFCKMIENFMKRLDVDLAPLYDPCVSGYLLRPDIFEGVKGSIETVIDADDEKFGLTDIYPDGSSNCLVANKIDKDQFLALVLERMARL